MPCRCRHGPEPFACGGPEPFACGGPKTLRRWPPGHETSCRCPPWTGVDLAVFAWPDSFRRAARCRLKRRGGGVARAAQICPYRTVARASPGRWPVALRPARASTAWPAAASRCLPARWLAARWVCATPRGGGNRRARPGTGPDRRLPVSRSTASGGFEQAEILAGDAEVAQRSFISVTQAQGVTSGGDVANCVIYFQPVHEILDAYNLRLVTRPSPPTRSAARASHSDAAVTPQRRCPDRTIDRAPASRAKGLAGSSGRVVPPDAAPPCVTRCSSPRRSGASRAGRSRTPRRRRRPGANP